MASYSRDYGVSDEPVVTIFVLISIISIFWTMNMTRGILTVGVTGMLYVVFLGAVAERARLHMLMSRIIRVYIGSALVMCGFGACAVFCGYGLMHRPRCSAQGV